MNLARLDSVVMLEGYSIYLEYLHARFIALNKFRMSEPVGHTSPPRTHNRSVLQSAVPQVQFLSLRFGPRYNLAIFRPDARGREDEVIIWHSEVENGETGKVSLVLGWLDDSMYGRFVETVREEFEGVSDVDGLAVYAHRE